MLWNLWKGLGAGLRAFRRNPGGFKLVAVLSLAMGVTRREAGDLDRALADFNRAIALDPSSALAYFCRGSILVAKGRFDEAITDFDRAVELEPMLKGEIEALSALALEQRPHKQ
jgi:tetratricopeptide (TPR) repeat protein